MGGRRGFAQCGHFTGKEGGGSSDVDGRPHFLATKTSDFSKFIVCPHGQGGRGLSQCGNFVDNGRGGQFFEILCRHPLWTAPNK